MKEYYKAGGEPLNKKNNGRRRSRKKIRRITMLMRKKMIILFLLIIVALSALGIKILVINVQNGEAYVKKVLSQKSYESTTIPYRRGDILDRNGTVLATSEKVYNLVIDCKAINGDDDYIEPTIAALVSILSADEATIREKLTNEATSKSQYQVLRTDVSIEEKQTFEAYKDYTDEAELTPEEKAARNDVRGVYFEAYYVRKYPGNTLASALVGFSNANGDGSAGVEQSYDITLKGIDGREYSYLDEEFQLQTAKVEPENGNTVVTTIDSNIQAIAEAAVAAFNETYQNGQNIETSGRGSANMAILIADPRTGEILGCATDTPYDLNNPQDLSRYYTEEEIAWFAANSVLVAERAAAIEKGEEVDTDVEIGTTTAEALLELWSNYAVSVEYEPGSTFKPMTIAAAIESGALSLDQTFECSSSYVVGDREITCYNSIAHGHQTVSQVLENSCNVGLIQIGQMMGASTFSKYLSIFNLGTGTGIDLSNEIAGTLHEELPEVELATSTFGQSFNLSMIQEVAAFNSVINGGYYYQPRIVKQILDEKGNVVKNIEPVLLRQTVSTNTSDLLKGYLQEAVEGGTGGKVAIEGYAIGGKTGTAEKYPRGNNKYLVSFIGFAPVDDPQVCVYVIIDEPNVEEQSNSGLAQEVARQVFEQILPYMNIFKAGTADTDEAETEVDGDYPVDEVVDEADNGLVDEVMEESPEAENNIDDNNIDENTPAENGAAEVWVEEANLE